MISSQQVQWPWQRIERDRRPYIWLALFLISMSGLVTGIAMHPFFAQGTTQHPNGSTPHGITNVQPTTTLTTTPSTHPVVTPQKFDVAIDPVAAAAPGGSFSITAHTTVAKTGRPAQGVTCQLTFTAASQIAPSPKQTTDATGSTTWAIAVPVTTPPGSYAMTITARWGAGFGADWQVTVTVG